MPRYTSSYYYIITQIIKEGKMAATNLKSETKDLYKATDWLMDPNGYREIPKLSSG